MKVCSLIAGMVLATCAITVIYPDVYRRMMRDGKRTIKNSKKLVSKMGL